MASALVNQHQAHLKKNSEVVYTNCLVDFETILIFKKSLVFGVVSYNCRSLKQTNTRYSVVCLVEAGHYTRSH